MNLLNKLIHVLDLQKLFKFFKKILPIRVVSLPS